MADIEKLQKRLETLEQNFNNFLKMYQSEKNYNAYDKDGLRHTDGVQGEAIETTSEDVADVRSAIEEVYEMIIEEGE